MYVCVREKERQRQRQRERNRERERREKERERERERECVRHMYALHFSPKPLLKVSNLKYIIII